MTAINTNTGSLYAQQSLNTNARSLATVMQQLSTGKRINNAVDDVAGLAISTRLTSQIRGLNQAVRNANDGISLVQTAEGATEQVTNMLQRMRELAIQASNDTNNAMDRGFLDGEFQQLKAEINRIGQNTQWNGANILDGTGGIGKDGKFAFQVGANSRQTISASLGNLQTFTEISDVAVAGTTTAPTFQFSGLDASLPADDPTGSKNMTGRVVTVTVESKQYRYTIKQDDVDTALTGGAKLSTKVATELGKLITADDSLHYTAGAGTGSDITKLVLAGKTGVTAAMKAALTMSFGGEGDLSAIKYSDILAGENAYKALGAIDSAMLTINAQRSSMGAVISRLQFASDNLSNVTAKAAESRSRIEDTDYSVATTELAKRNIIQQAAQAMLAQANQAPQLVLQLLK